MGKHPSEEEVVDCKGDMGDVLSGTTEAVTKEQRDEQ